ncbi:MAG TPA: amidohydrolase family protein [Steroidobacteraceae bacterium]|nr:amidohydrolase family protein [Steroidobacteraceae bacterium]
MTPELEIVDSHVHLWDLTRIRYPWLTPPLPAGITGDVSPIARDYLLDDYLADASAPGVPARVTKIVHVEAGADPADSLAETRWLQSVADQRGFPQAIIAHAELEKPTAAALLAEHAAHRNVRGIRQIINWHPDPAKTYTPRDLLADESWHQGFAQLAPHGLSFDLQIYPAQMPAAARLAARHPDIPLILNHTGMPVDKDAAGIDAWRAGLRALAARPNISVKVSGLAMLDWQWSRESLRPFVLETLEIFGADRVMIASNFPVDRLFGSFASFYGAYHSLLGGASEEERTKLFARNAERIYRI